MKDDAAHSKAVNVSLLLLTDLNCRVFKRHVGLFRPVRRTGFGPPQKLGVIGEPDIQGIMNGGWFIGVEIKTGKATRTPAQRQFGNMIENMGGCYIVAQFADPIANPSDGLDAIVAGIRKFQDEAMPELAREAAMRLLEDFMEQVKK